MKNFLVLFLFTTLFGLVACNSQNDLTRVDPSEVDEEKVELAEALSDRILRAQREGGYYEFKEYEATEDMVNGLSEEAQKKAYKGIKRLFGEYQNLEFDHMMRTSSGDYYGIYRFKGRFDNQKSEVEVRAVLNKQDQLAGFFVRPWK